jgi:type IX secretion system PorP/SprF family membrane protein
MKKFFYATALLACFGAADLSAQDPHFSQFYQSPMTLNPALTSMTNWGGRVTANYRNQWATVTAPYQTFALSGEAGLFRQKLNGDFVGAGLFALNDVAGDANYRSTQIGASLAYHKSLGADDNQWLSAGVQLGAVQRSLDFTRLFFDNQFNGDILDQNLPSGENINRNQFWYFDVAAGLSYTAMPNERTSFYAGASVFHIAEPNQSFMGDEREVVFRKFLVHAGAEFALNDKVSLLPQAVFMTQGPARQVNIGTLVKFKIGDQFYFDPSNNAFYIGLTHRFGDAFIGTVRVDWGPVIIGVSYDINMSSLVTASRTVGGPELSLQYRIGQPEDLGGMRCPTF